MLPTQVNTIQEAKQVLAYLIGILGAGFHPDTPIADYVNLYTKERTFTASQVNDLQPLLDSCFQIFEANNQDIYKASFPCLITNDRLRQDILLGSFQRHLEYECHLERNNHTKDWELSISLNDTILNEYQYNSQRDAISDINNFINSGYHLTEI